MLLADANVILETLLPNRPKVVEAEACLRGRTVSISMLTVYLAYHFGCKEGYAVADIRQNLADYKILDLTREDYGLAGSIVRGRDFEDALQLAVALRNGCDAVATLDSKFAKTYKDQIRFIVPS